MCVHTHGHTHGHGGTIHDLRQVSISNEWVNKCARMDSGLSLSLTKDTATTRMNVEDIVLSEESDTKGIILTVLCRLVKFIDEK